MRFNLPSYESHEPLRVLSPTDVPMLKTIVVRGNARGAGFPLADNEPFSFASSTSLRGLSFESLLAYFIYAIPSLSQIRHLSLHGPTLMLDEALTMLRQSPLLETCTLQIHARVTTRSPPIRIENLRRLCIIDSGGPISTQLLRYFDLPYLKTFEYSASSSRRQAFAGLTAPHMLTSLGLSVPISTKDFIDCLRIFPMLQNLVLHRPPASLGEIIITLNELFTVLTPSSDNATETLCPNLRTFSCFGIEAGKDYELLNMIRLRHERPDIQSLSRVHVVFVREPHMDITLCMSWLARFAPGLTVVLRYPSKADTEFMNWRSRAAATPRRDQDSWEADWGPLSSRWEAEYA